MLAGLVISDVDKHIKKKVKWGKDVCSSWQRAARGLTALQTLQKVSVNRKACLNRTERMV